MAHWREDPPAEPSRPNVERKLRELVEQGYFDNLPGSGKPLDLSDEDNPFIPGDMRLAYRIPRNAGMSLPWIELGNEVETDLAELRRRIDARERRLRVALGRPRHGLPGPRAAALASVRAQHAAFLTRFEKSAGELNRKIDTYNLGVPTVRVQKPRFNVQAALARIRDALGDQLDEGD